MQEIQLSDDGAVVWPSLHDGIARGLLLCADKRVLLPIQVNGGLRHCLVLHDVERLRADDFRQGNIILDVTVSRGMQIDPADVAYASDINADAEALLSQTMHRLIENDSVVVRINPSYGCSAVFICGSITVETDRLPQ